MQILYYYLNYFIGTKNVNLELLFNSFIIIFLLFLNGFFVAAEFSLVGVRKTRIRQLSEEGNFSAKLAMDALKNIDKYIAAVQLGITIASLGLGWVGESTLARIIKPLFEFLPGDIDSVAAHTVSVTTAFIFITVMHVVAGELMPKSVALQFPEKTTLWVAKPMYLIAKIFSPMIYLLNGLGNFLLKLCKIEPNASHQTVHSAEELNMLIDASYKGGALNEKEAEILQNAFKFSDLTVSQVMIPRQDVVGLPVDIEWEDLKKILTENQYTRYPVYADDYDHIKGFLHIKDLLPLIADNHKVNLNKILREPFYIPETMTIDKLALEFQKQHLQMAIVVDEFGGTSGIITMEDILEEIFGEVQDEFDDEETDIKKIDDNNYEICGKMRTDEFCELFNVDIDDEDITTLGGYVVKKLGRIACEKDEVKDEYFKYCVSEMNASRILKLKIERLYPDKQD